MGDKNDKSNFDFEENKDKDLKKRKSPFIITFFDFNRFLGEFLRLIIYLIIFMILYFIFFDKNNENSSLEAINQLDMKNQIIGEVSVVGSEIVLDEMLINTSDELENHFVKIKMIISYGDQETGLEINRRLNEIYDRVRKVVGRKKFIDLKYVDDQELLSLEIKTEIQKITGKIDIYNIFFKDFTIY